MYLFLFFQTATSLALLLHRLGKETRVVEKLYEEISREMPSVDTEIDGNLLSKMPYLKAVIEEGHRWLLLKLCAIGIGKP